MPYAQAHEMTDAEKLEANRHDGLAFIGLTLIAFSIAVFYVAREGLTANSLIYLSGAIASIVALLRMRFAPIRRSPEAPSPLGCTRHQSEKSGKNTERRGFFDRGMISGGLSFGSVRS